MAASYSFESVAALGVVALLVLSLVYLQPNLFKKEGFATLSAAGRMLTARVAMSPLRRSLALRSLVMRSPLRAATRVTSSRRASSFRRT